MEGQRPSGVLVYGCSPYHFPSGDSSTNMALVSAAPYLALLGDLDPSLKAYALSSLNDVVDELWAEIANSITELEELYEDPNFEKRSLAALIMSKVYYNLGDFEASVKYSLCAGDEFDVEEQSQYIETIVSQCISLYNTLSQQAYNDKSVKIDPQLTTIFEKMLDRCVNNGDLKLALGVSLESYHLDNVERILKQVKNDETALSLINYVVMCSNTVLEDSSFRTDVLKSMIQLLLGLKTHRDFFSIFKVIVQLGDTSLAVHLFEQLLDSDDALTAYQGAFDLVGTASQELLDNILESLEKLDKSNHPTQFARLTHILTGVPLCDLEITFLYKNNNTDISILNKTKNSLEGRSSIFHSAVTFANAFMHCGTTDDSFFRKNLEWLGKATNWSKFSATAALGVIHKGNLSQGRNILKPYLPGSSGSPHTKGGSLFALGLIFAGQGRDAIDYLKLFLDEHGSTAGNNDNDVMLHGACLGCGVAGMGCRNENLLEALKVVLYSDSAISGQAAGLAMGLVMLGSGDQTIARDMLTYAQETQHENIIRGLAIGIALLFYQQELKSLTIVDELMAQENPILRYGGAFTISLAYAGTGNNDAIKKLLHYAVSDPSDDVRRASVMGLGFLLIRDYTATPQIVELLSQSHNPHVRYGAAMALGISCAGRSLPAAIDILEPLTKDSVDFVRQGALMATSMILIQQNENLYPKVKEFTQLYADTVRNKHEDALAKFGATLSQGIIDAGGRNVTINLENSHANTLNTSAIVGLAVFAQSWYWFPFVHFLSLSFSPTAIIGVVEDLKVPKFELNCHSRPELFQYPPKVEESKEKQPDKVATAVLSTTAKAKARARKNKKHEDTEDDKMEVEISKNEEKETKGDKDEEKKEEKEIANETQPIRYLKTPFKIENMSRVLPAQSHYISFVKDDRFVPVRKYRGNAGVIVLRDTKAGEKFEAIKTVRQLNITEAPVPEPFTLSGEDLEDDE